MPAPVCWIDDRILPLDAAAVPVRDHGLLYGDGVFEGVRFYHGRPFRLDAHLRRLADSARALALTLPRDGEPLAGIVERVIEAYGAETGYLRIIVTRGDGPLGIDPAACPRPRQIVIADRLEMVSPARRETGVRLIIAATRRLPPDGLDPRIKSLNYLNHVLARIEANAAGADEAVLLNAAGRVAEGTADNLFLARNGTLLTPPVIDGALAGITRDLVLELARDAGICVRETSLAPYDLYTADECFLTGTGAELIPVASIDGRPLPACPGPLFRQCHDAFVETVARECRAGE